jgi:hypothetical protein
LGTALTLKWFKLQDNHWIGLLGVHDAQALSIISDAESLAFPEGINNTVLDDGSYADNIATPASRNADVDSWHEVTKTGVLLQYGCVCGQSFDSEFARTLHLRSAPVGTRYDIAPETRPRLSSAWVLF